jgi:hypothetical protein
VEIYVPTKILRDFIHIDEIGLPEEWQA